MKNKKTIIGFNFLHNHPNMERQLDVDEEHVIVDKFDWEKVVHFFDENPHLLKEIINLNEHENEDE